MLRTMLRLLLKPVTGTATDSILISRKRARTHSFLTLRLHQQASRDFLMSEVRYTSLSRKFPEIAEELFAKAERDAQDRTESYLRLKKEYDA